MKNPTEDPSFALGLKGSGVERAGPDECRYRCPLAKAFKSKKSKQILFGGLVGAAQVVDTVSKRSLRIVKHMVLSPVCDFCVVVLLMA